MKNRSTRLLADFIFIHDKTNEKYQNYLSEIKKNLNEKECEMFTLVVEMKLAPKDVAAALKISDVNFRVRWHRLRNKLTPIIKKMIEK